MVSCFVVINSGPEGTVKGYGWKPAMCHIHIKVILHILRALDLRVWKKTFLEDMDKVLKGQVEDPSRHRRRSLKNSSLSGNYHTFLLTESTTLKGRKYFYKSILKLKQFLLYFPSSPVFHNSNKSCFLTRKKSTWKVERKRKWGDGDKG